MSPGPEWIPLALVLLLWMTLRGIIVTAQFVTRMLEAIGNDRR